jgi:quercetin dioxygenase-like cupin family protein
MKVRLLSPFEDGEPIWIGLDTPGMRRKVSRLVSPSIGSEEFMGGVTIFDPGESSSMHIHEDSEEINIVLGGGGTIVSDDEEREFTTGEWMWIPRGTFHQHRNTGTEPLQLAWIYTPQADLPSS